MLIIHNDYNTMSYFGSTTCLYLYSVGSIRRQKYSNKEKNKLLKIDVKVDKKKLDCP